MRIVNLQAENVKRLRAVEVKPSADVVVISGRNGQGKQQPVSEPVLTPTGWCPIGSLRVGDSVIGADGKPTTVLNVFPQTDRRVFVVQMACGSSTRCGIDHLWTIQRWSGGGNLVTETLTLADMLARGLRAGSHRRYSVPVICGPVEFADSGENLPVDPYTLGVILGDGHIEPTGYVTITSYDPEVLDWLKVEGWRDRTGTVLATGAWSRPLVHLGLAGRRAWEKFVPDAYLRAAVEDRRALLLGLMDTDGTVPKSWATFTSTSEALADAVVDLASSLGWHASKRPNGPKRYTYLGELKTGRPSWDVLVKSDEPPFRLDRKNRRWKVAVKRPVPRRFIDSVTQVADEDSVCIQVAAVDGLYVTNDWIVTHNTSVLDSIWYALAGAAATKETPRPIRDGEEKAKVRLDLGELVVTRTWKGDKTQLKVESNDGASYSSPQAMLDGLVGSLSFDPLAFSQQPDREQLATLLSLVDLPFVPAQLDAERRRLFDERTAVGRDGKALEGQLAGLPESAEGIPTEELSLASLLAERQAAVDLQRENEDRRREEDGIATNVEHYINLVAQLQGQLTEAQRLLGEHQQGLTVARAQVEALVNPDITSVDVKLAGLEETNRAVRAAKQRDDVARQVAAARTAYDALSAQISDLDERKAAALREARMPIEGLGFNTEGVTYRGLPFRQCSASERLRVSLAMAMAMNPKLRVIRITDGSLLDSENMRLIGEMAGDHDFQVWLEVVDESGHVGVVIEDGSVVSEHALASR